jgi:hypothetical protein
MKLNVTYLALTLGLAGLPVGASAQNVGLLLFDGENGTEFAGCLNCSRYEDTSVCNKYGDYGSRYSDESIWNRYGKFGSKYETNSPWNKYGEGLRIVDSDGNYYGKFTISRIDRSRLELVNQIAEAYERLDDLDELRDLLCE